MKNKGSPDISKLHSLKTFVFLQYHINFKMGVFKLIFSVFLLISVANGIIFKDYDGIRIGQESVYVPKYRKAGGGILAGRSLLGSDDGKKNTVPDI